MKALVTGITGQDGPYLARHLLDMGHDVIGIHRRACEPNLQGLKFLGINNGVRLIEMELTEYEDVRSTISEVKPDMIFNLAAQSHVGTSFKQPIYTTGVNYLGVLNILESLRGLGMIEHTRVYQASTSEMFGGQNCPETGYNEQSPFWPRSPYGVAKLAAHWLVRNYRESYGLFGCCGILFNHESPLRGLNFVTRKVTSGLADLAFGTRKEPLKLGNLEASRDWGHANDYTEAMVKMLVQREPEDFVIATGRSCSVRHMIEVACYYLGIDSWEWEGEGVNEKLVDSNGVLVEINPEFYRPAEVDTLIGDSSKAKEHLGWEPDHLFEDLIRDMCGHDMAIARRKADGLKSKSAYKQIQTAVEKNT